MANQAKSLAEMPNWIWRLPTSAALSMYPEYAGPLLGSALPFYLGYTDDYTVAAQFKVKREQLVVAAAANSSTADTAFLPANSLIFAVGYYVDVAIPTAATFQLGDATQAARFGTGISVAINTKGRLFPMWDPTIATAALGPRQTANASLRLTPSATPATAVGRVRLWVFYLEFPEDLVAIRTGP